MKHIPNTGRFAIARWIVLGAMIGVLHGSGDVRAQDGFDANLFPNFSLGGFGDQSDAEPVRWTARYFVDNEGSGRVEVEAVLSPTWHIYSTTQKPGGPTRTVLSVSKPASATASGPFTPDHEPAKSVSSIYDGLTVEEHGGTVIWSAPIAVPIGFREPITVTVKGLVCKSGGDNRCMPVQESLTAIYTEQAGGDEALTAEGDNSPRSAVASGSVATDDKTSAGKPFRDEDYVVEWRASLEPSVIAPGQTGVLRFTATPDETYHVYQSTVDDADSSTNFVVTGKSGVQIGEPVANKPVETHAFLPTLEVKYYPGQVTWQLPIKIPDGTAPGEKLIEGMIGYQACTDSSCQRPVALKFATRVTVAEQSGQDEGAVELAVAKRAEALDAAAMTQWVDPIKLEASAASKATTSSKDAGLPIAPLATQGGGGDRGASNTSPTAETSLPIILGLAFLGGLILNVMPCVLPVVGLKIMGFVKQAGEDRNRVLVLNLVYVLGIMAVFAVFAVVAAVSKFGWGEQFTYFPVRLTLTLMLFALALSYLGVWEIPAPGMAGGKASQELQSREGLAGAFSKGVFATILATPCSGPLLGYILGLTLNLSAAYTIAIFLTVGLGMSLPYIIIGLKPSLVTWLPKPGPWMETVKQLMAFLFLGTVAFFFAQFNDAQKVPVFVSLIAVWFGCWIIGQVPNWAELQKRALAWTGGIAAATLISMWAFAYLKPDYKLAWEDYSEPRLQQLQSEGRTVMVDFGAKWCGTCILNYEVAINTHETREVIDELNAVALYADWTDYSPEIKQKLEELNSRSIPLLAIYPGSRPNEPIILRDIVTQDRVIEALREAGASVEFAASSPFDNRGSSLASASP